MESQKTQVMPYIFVCGSGIMNLILMSMPFLNHAGQNFSGYIIISRFGGAFEIVASVLQILIMLLAFAMMIYGAIGILYTCGVTGIDMSKKFFRNFCAVPILLIDILYVIQFVFILIVSAKTNTWVGIGVYMSLFLNISVTIINSVLLKEPKNKG